MRIFTKASHKVWVAIFAVAVTGIVGSQTNYLESSSHREAPMIANDPQADNTDLYAFRNPNDPSKLIIIANYIPFQSPQGGPYYYFFGTDVAYDIHIKNQASTKGDDIMYRFTFKTVNEDPETFFYARLGKQNVKQTYTVTKSMDGGKSFSTILSNGKVPAYNAGPRTIETPVGLNTNYHQEFLEGIERAASGEVLFAGPREDPFFIDVGAIFDLGNLRLDNAVDGLRCKNVHSIAMEIPISTLQKDGKHPDMAKSIFDSDFVLGIWASASRPKITVRDANGKMSSQGPLVQVSRLGMPLTNEVIIPIGRKDEWNSMTPYNESKDFEKYFTNPELALYIDNTAFGDAVPQLGRLPLQTNSLGQFDFRNRQQGLYPLLNTQAVKGTALDPAIFGNYLLRPNAPRSVDILPIFMTGVPNLPPYQLATGKNGNPLAKGKPFINNFLPVFGDMLRINVSTPTTPRNSPDFSRLGLIKAAVLGLTDPRFNTTTDWDNIPNLDGFPNGRRLEDDVVDIGTMAMSGVVLAAIGLWYDDFTPGTGMSPVTQDLLTALTAGDGVNQNDKPFLGGFPFVGQPYGGLEGGTCDCGDSNKMEAQNMQSMNQSLNVVPSKSSEQGISTYPSPANESTTIRFNLVNESAVTISIYDITGKLIATPVQSKKHKAGVHEAKVNLTNFTKGVYIATMRNSEGEAKTVKFIIEK
jgi:hypothetical protein